jgi:nicotinate-nucleotide pyrophosphorylase (carboxylating)
MSAPDTSLEAVIRAELRSAGDRAASLLFGPEQTASLAIIQKEAGILFGFDAAQLVFNAAGEVSFTPLAPEGVMTAVVPRRVALVTGNARQVFNARRTAVNLIARLSGVATITERFVRAVDGLPARIAGTRKTSLVLAAHEGRAIESVGGVSWTSSAGDRVLLKALHSHVAGGITQAIERARTSRPGVKLDVECESLAEVASLSGLGVSRIVLDNMWPREAAEAMEKIRGWGQGHGRPLVEATGSISLVSARAYAEAGVDQLTIGALTRAAPSLDFNGAALVGA